MISKLEFIKQIDRLKMVYGRESYPEERVRILYLECNQLSNEDLTAIVSKMIGESRFPPLIKEFREAISERRLITYETQKEHRTNEMIEHWGDEYQDTKTVGDFMRQLRIDLFGGKQ